MNLLVALLLLVVLVAATLRIHHEVLVLLSTRLVPRLHHFSRPPVEWLLACLLVAHLLEVVVFGAGYWLAADVFGLGQLVGAHTGSFRSFVYFSGVTYTSLGLGDSYPTGELRMMAGIQALTGLLLIGWSASYIFVEMQRLWHDEPPDPSVPFPRQR